MSRHCSLTFETMQTPNRLITPLRTLKTSLVSWTLTSDSLDTKSLMQLYRNNRSPPSTQQTWQGQTTLVIPALQKVLWRWPEFLLLISLQLLKLLSLDMLDLLAFHRGWCLQMYCAQIYYFSGEKWNWLLHEIKLYLVLHYINYAHELN